MKKKTLKKQTMYIGKGFKETNKNGEKDKSSPLHPQRLIEPSKRSVPVRKCRDLIDRRRRRR